MSDSAIATQALSKRFGATVAVQELSLEVPKGTVFGFLGPNGSGKTTTVRLLLGLLEPDAGSASVLGTEVVRDADRVRAVSGVLLERAGLYERLTAEDNLELFGRIWRVPRSDRRARTRELLEQINLWDRKDDIVRDWSTGMRQKLAIARALYHRPAVLFLDEPTRGLDPVATASLHDDIQRLVHEEGVTVFLNTHNLAEAEKLCHRIGVIRRGRLVAEGTPEDVRARGKGQHITVQADNVGAPVLRQVEQLPGVRNVMGSDGGFVATVDPGASAAPIVESLVRHGVSVEEVRKETASLEEVFLTLVEEEES
jgi:ABC-2 type transport system ATP-binding protein